MLYSGRILALAIIFLSLTGSARALTGELHPSFMVKAVNHADTSSELSSQMFRDINKALKIFARKAVEINKD